MTKLTIVGLHGKAGAGKDTAAQYLAEALQARQRKTATMAFAEPMRAALLAMGVPSSYIYNRELKEQPVPGFGRSYRELAQTMGTEWGRTYNGDDFWIQLLAERVVVLGTAGRLPDVLLVTDVRFQNEADWIKARGGLLVHVVRPGLAGVREHMSEAGVHGCTELLNNATDLIDLRAQCGVLSNKVLAHAALQA